MKKYLIYAGMLLLGMIVTTSCSNEEQLQQIVNDGDYVHAIIENMSEARTSVNNSYQVEWTANDEFDVWDGETFKGVLILKGGEGTTSGSFKDKDEQNPVGATNGMTAFFPSYNNATHQKAFVFAKEYTSQETDAPMLGSFDGSKFTFNLLTAMVRVVVTDVPAGNIVLTISNLDNLYLTGLATLDNENKLTVPTSGSTEVSVKLTTTETQTLTFDIPIPVQNYINGLKAVVKSDENIVLDKTTNPFNAVAGKLYKFDANSSYVLVDNVDDANTELAKDDVTEVIVETTINANDQITVPAKSEASAKEEHTIDLSGATLPSSGIIGINVTESTGNDGKSTLEKLTIVVPDNTNADILNINAPSTTVTIISEGGTIIAKIEATTADETLIIGNGVTITDLVVTAGNVRIKNGGSVGKITRSQAAEEEKTIYVIFEGNLPETPNSDPNIIYMSAAEWDLRKAIAESNNVILKNDVILTDAITINKTVTIDLNGYTIENKSAANTTKLGNAADECIVFYVDGSEASLTLNATNGGKVIATGDGSTTYYNVAVWVTNGAVATINGGEYYNTADPNNDGCDLIYGRDGGKIYITGGTFKAGAIRSDLGGGIYGVLNCKDTKGSVITVSGGKFYEYGAAEAAKVGNGEVILLEGGYYWSAKDAEGYYTVTDKIETEEALKSAIANTANVKLGSNITLTDAITISKAVTIDLNGFTIENKSANNTTQLGNVADECIIFYVDGAEANLTLNATNGGKVIATGDGSTSYYNVAVWVTNGATATINGGEFYNTADPNNDGCDLIYGRDGGKIYITGGTFKAGAIRSDLGGGIYGVLNCKDTKGSVITVSGGKFYEYGAAEAAKVGNGEVILLDSGYEWSEKDSEDYYSVIPINK